jgi:hypothetical protein
MMDVVVFNVEMGQSIFFYPHGHPEYGMLVDCGNTQNFDPIDILISSGLIHHDGRSHILGNLTLTNYDHDHFSGLPYLSEKVHIDTIRFPKNISAEELLGIKPEKTKALDSVCHLKRTYTVSASYHQPPYRKAAFYLERHHFPMDREISTNNLSQVVFVEYLGTKICISGDLEADGWELMLGNENFKQWLIGTNVFIAAHHGRENGYAEEVFEYCFPECIIISDKKIVHGTQEGMSQAYAEHVIGEGVYLNGDLRNPRKVLTTRSDGHILIRLGDNGVRAYKSV